MAHQRYEYISEEINEKTGKPKSAKFWIGWCEGSTIWVRYGRIGTEGTTDDKVFDSKEDAEKELARRIKAKIKKGYAPV